MAVAAAAAGGAAKVLAADIFPAKLALAAEMGAARTVHTREEDLVQAILQETGGRGADVIIDYTGNAG